MRTRESGPETVLNLRAGELVEVRSEAEILATLDAQGRLDALPFMPEMLEFCGKQFRVSKRAHKTCDTITKTGGRRMKNTVHLGDLRCDGAAHGGCQARCLIFWKEAWLRRVAPGLFQRMASRMHRMLRPSPPNLSERNISMTREALLRTTRASQEASGPGEEVYACQATELVRASTHLAWWDLRQYFTDVTSGNVGLLDLVWGGFWFSFRNALKFRGYRALMWSYTTVQRRCGGTPYPFRRGKLTKTPTAELSLQEGELVQIRSYDEILATLNEQNRNRGLFFDAEMVPYCGGQYRVLRRVERIINERTGKMSHLPGVCIMLEGVYCKARYSDRRMFCPRGIPPYWHEIWLKRVE